MGGFRARERNVQKLLTAAVLIGVANQMGGFRARERNVQKLLTGSDHWSV